LTPPSIDKRLVELRHQNIQQTLQPTRQKPRFIRSKSLLFLTAGILLLMVLIVVGR
jgi:hypothetical protein